MSSEVSKFNGEKHWENVIAKENYSVMKDYLSSANKSRKNAKRMEDARYGKQFSDAEVKQLRIFRQAPLPINISSAIADTADALQISAKPTVDVAPILNPYDDAYSEESYKVSSIFKHVIQKDWFDSLGALEYDKTITDRTSTGTGLLYAVPRMEFGEFKVDVKNISWKYFLPDPSSTDYLYQDMDNMVIAMPISKKAAYRFVQAIESDLSYEDFLDYWVNGGLEHNFPEEDSMFGKVAKGKVLFAQRLTLEVEDSWAIVPSDKYIKQGATQEEIAYRTTSMLTDALKDQQKAGEIKLVKQRKMYLVEYTSIGSLGYKIVYPISKYNIVPFHYDHRGTPYTYGMMWKLYPLQRALNKFIMSAMLNMALLNTTKVLAEEDSIINENEWIQSASIPNAILKYKLPVPGHSQRPEIVKPTPMDSAFLVMPQYLIKMMEYVSGIFGVMQGNSEGSSDVFSTVASMQSAGGIKIKRRQVHADASLSLFGSVMADFYKEYAPMNSFSYNLTEEGKEDIVKYNEVLVNKDDKGKVRVSINPQNDLRKGYKKVRFISTGSMGYESATEAAMLTTLATQLSLPALVPSILERMNIPGLKDITDSLDVNKQLTSQNSQLQQVVQEIEKKNNTMETQIFQMAKSLEAAKVKGKLDVELQKFKDNPMGYLEKATTMQGED